MVDTYWDAKRWGIYTLLFTDPDGGSCFSIYQIRWIKKCCFNFFFWNFRETTRHFLLCSQNSEYTRIFQVTGANQNTRKLLSTDLVDTKYIYIYSVLDSILVFLLAIVTSLNCIVIEKPLWGVVNKVLHCIVINSIYLEVLVGNMQGISCSEIVLPTVPRVTLNQSQGWYYH